MSDWTIEQRTRTLKPRGIVNESKDGRLHVILEMPGVRKEDLDIRIENNEMRIVGKREPEANRRYVLHERPRGDFLQTFTLDDTVDTSRVEATIEKGILSLTLELKEHVKPRTIPVRGE
jgi:HSP20 family protein